MTDEALRELVSFEELVTTLVYGEHPGLESGDGGMEFDHLKPWEPGDSPRDINRIASYKQEELIMNVRLPEREIVVLFVVDTSKSMFFGSHTFTKMERTLKFLEKAIYIGKEDRPFFSLTHLSEKIVRTIPLGIGETAVNIFAKIDFLKESDTDSFSLLPFMSTLRKQGGGRTYIVLVFSDFVDVACDYENEIHALIRMGHKVCGIAVLDPWETEMPSLPFGMISARDLETGKSILAKESHDFLTPHKEVFHNLNSLFAVFDNPQTQEDAA